MTTATLYRVNSPHVVHQVFEDGEAAIINLKSGVYYSLDAVGASIWTLIGQGYSLGEIVEDTYRRYDGSLVEIINDVNALVASLLAEELIATAPSAAHDGHTGAAHRSVGSPPPARLPYKTPLLERFDDMQELLLLDPIHEVGDQGWPHASGVQG